jgi:hypothetical protein
MTTEKLLVPTIERLAAENVALREACAEANERLVQLEEEKQRFLDEGVFDLVNSVCGKSGAANADGSGCKGRSLLSSSSIAGSSPGAGDSADGLQTLLDTAEAAAAVFDTATAGRASSTGAASLPQEAPLAECRDSTSPLRSELGAHLQLSPEEIQKRTEELSGENERLRQELACSGKYGETLQLQQQLVEDEMHALEQENRWLAQCLQGQSVRDAQASPHSPVDGEVLPQSAAGLRPEEAELEAPAEAGAGGPCVHSCQAPHQREQVLSESLTMTVVGSSSSQIETSQPPPA